MGSVRTPTMKPPNAPAALPTMILDMSSTPVKTYLLLISHAACRSYGPATGKLSRACGGVFGPFDLLDQAEEFISRFPIALGPAASGFQDCSIRPPTDVARATALT